MMTYNELIASFSEISENDLIQKTGLTLTYELSDSDHKKMDEELFYKTNDRTIEFVHRNIIELEIGEFNVNIIKKK